MTARSIAAGKVCDRKRTPSLNPAWQFQIGGTQYPNPAIDRAQDFVPLSSYRPLPSEGRGHWFESSRARNSNEIK